MAHRTLIFIGDGRSRAYSITVIARGQGFTRIPRYLMCPISKLCRRRFCWSGPITTGITSLQLGDNGTLDLQDGIETANGSQQIIIGGVIQDLADYSGGDLAGVNLGSAQHIGDLNVQVDQAVTLESGVEGQAIIISIRLTRLSLSLSPDVPASWQGPVGMGNLKFRPG